MAPLNIRDLLTAFSPKSDYFSLSSGDGRIKVWNTVNGQLQTEFADLAPPEESSLLLEHKKGHLSLDYTCMKWVERQSKKKRKEGVSLLVLGTGGGDVLGLDVAAGKLRWKVCDCHAGGVTAVSSPANASCIYTGGADGMVCQIDTSTGSLLGKFRASAKSISTITVSADGKILVTAAGQLKTFNCSDKKKIQKFSGHPVAVRCLSFSEDGNYILSSGVGEKHIAIWKVGGGKKQPAVAVLSMEHPTVYVDSKTIVNEGIDGVRLAVIAISENGVCYFWHGSSINDLHNSHPSRISFSTETSSINKRQDLTIYAANLLAIAEPASGEILVACGSLVKPSFQKLSVTSGLDIKLDKSQEGVLLQLFDSSATNKEPLVKKKVTALDRANAEDAILPLPKLYEQGTKRKHSLTTLVADIKNAMTDPVYSKISPAINKVNYEQMDGDGIICIEDRLRELGILRNKNEISTMSLPSTADDSLIDENLPEKKIRANIAAMSDGDAYSYLKLLLSRWKHRLNNSKYILPWIYWILVKHGQYIVSQESSVEVLGSLQKMISSRLTAHEPLHKLSGRFQLIMAQIDKAGGPSADVHRNDAGVVDGDGDGDGEEEEEEEIDEMVYGVDESQSSSDEENEQQS